MICFLIMECSELKTKIPTGAGTESLFGFSCFQIGEQYFSFQEKNCVANANFVRVLTANRKCSVYLYITKYRCPVDAFIHIVLKVKLGLKFN